MRQIFAIIVFLSLTLTAGCQSTKSVGDSSASAKPSSTAIDESAKPAAQTAKSSAQTFKQKLSAMSLRELKAAGYSAMKAQNYRLAERYLTAAYYRYEGKAKLALNLGVIYRKSKRFKQAKIMFRAVVDLDPKGIIKLSPAAAKRSKVKTLIELATLNWNLSGEHDAAMKLTPNLRKGKEIYEEFCSEKCHLKEAGGSHSGTYPQIASQHRSVLLKQLADIRSKNRDNPKMFRWAQASEIGGEQAMADVTAYIARLPMRS